MSFLIERSALSALVTILVATIGGAQALGQHAPPPTPNRVASEACASVLPELDRQLQALDRHEVTYSYRLYTPRPGEAPTMEIPDDAEAPDRLFSVVIATVKRCGIGYRIDERTIWSRDHESQGRLLTYASDGVEFHTRFGWANSTIGNVMLDLNDSMHRVASEMDAYGLRVFGEVAPVDFQYYMRFGAASMDTRWTALSDERGKASWRWLPNAPQTRLTATINQSTATLEAICMDIHDQDADRTGARVQQRKAIDFRRHIVGGVALRGARLGEAINDGGPGWPANWSLGIVEPIAIRPIECSADWMHIVPVPGQVVQDTRFDVAYHSGGPTMNLEGRLLHLGEPVLGDAGWGLDELVRDLSPAPQAAPPVEARQPTADDPGIVVFDAGNFEMLGEPVRVTHQFVVRNDSARRWEIDQVIPSCGCLTCEMSAMSIEPGQSATLAVEMVMPYPGLREQHVALALKHGEIMRFVLRAHGLADGSLRVMSSGLVRHGDSLSTSVRVYWVESDPALRVAEPAAPVLTGIDGATLAFDGWHVIEPVSEDGSRPRRLLGHGRIDIPVASVAEPEREVAFKIACGHKRERSMTLEVRSEASSARK